MATPIGTVEELRAVPEGGEVSIGGGSPSEWIVNGGRLVQVKDESVKLSPHLFASAIHQGLVTSRVPSPPFVGEATELVAALRKLARTDKTVRDLLVQHGAAELETCVVTVTLEGTIHYPTPMLEEPTFTNVRTIDGSNRWSRTVPITREGVMGCQCATVTRDEIAEFAPKEDKEFAFTVTCNLHS